MMRRLMAVAASVGVFLTASLAQAQGHPDFGKQGEFIISADRLVPLFAYTHVSQDQFTGGNTKITSFYNESSLSILWGSSGNSGLAGGDTFFTVPRVGFDYTVIPSLTVGGDLVVWFTLGGSNGTDTTTNGNTITNKNDNPGGLLFGVAPRVGYILPLTDLFAIWLRGGVSFYVANSKVTNNPNLTTSNSINQFALDLDPQFVITPVPHFGFTIGLTADIPITGGHSTERDTPGGSTTQSAWSSIFFLGVTGGILGYF
jgi:hypothetical protein